jgi:hypothetical protein
MLRNSREAVVATIAVLGAVPVASGTLGMIAGPEGAPGGGPTTPSVDSEYRFVNLFWAAAGVILWWSLRKPDERAHVTRLLLGLAAAGGLPRLLSIARKGLPHPVFRAALVLELVIVPIVLVWHARAYRR